ncbi:hypothetical protein ACLGI4_28205 [Streptomyces sp. HMX112]|uniref:hypothetical protein n=1 Tax=Streptomyces sp. HMX112 TaxID=3390850 RepID=UPI003A7FA91D
MHDASTRFRFRFVARGWQSNDLVMLAVRSLLCCHPSAHVVVVDANDEPMLAAEHFGPGGNVTVVHLRPDDDPVSRAAGKGTAGHLFYWRHSPALLGSLPPWPGYDVHADADLLFLRPMDLSALKGPLARGRIAAVVDESTMDYYSELGRRASMPLTAMLDTPGAGGPLLQAGLLFSNPADDGGFYDLLWRFAVTAAEAGLLHTVPSDDMGVVSSLLGRRGPLWERSLPLGHEWNYISGALKDPGVFGCVAHFGGRRAKKFLLAQSGDLFPPDADVSRTPWGSMRLPVGPRRPTVVRGLWRRTWLPADEFDETAPSVGGAAPARDGASIEIALPFCLSWRVPPGHPTALVDGIIRARRTEAPAEDGAEPVLFVYLDGHLIGRVPAEGFRFRCPVRLGKAETITLIGTSPSSGHTLRLHDPFRTP